MIRINIIKQNNLIKSITFKGHADYDEYGKDIVCSAVSATYLCTVNAILSLNNDSIKVSNNNDLQEVVTTNDNEITQTLLNNMINCLKSLEEQYPNNVKIK